MLINLFTGNRSSKFCYQICLEKLTTLTFDSSKMIEKRPRYRRKLSFTANYHKAEVK